MTDVGGGLTRFESHHDALGVDGAESVDHDFTLDGLNGVNHDGYCSRVELFE